MTHQQRQEAKGPGNVPSSASIQALASATDDEVVENRGVFVAAVHSVIIASALKDRWILDLGSDIHVTNNLNYLYSVQLPGHRTRVIAGITIYNVKALGYIQLVIRAPKGHKATITLT